MGIKKLMLQEREILEMATQYANRLDFTDDHNLNEKGCQKVKKWARDDFAAGVIAACKKIEKLTIRKQVGDHKKVLMVYPGLNEKFYGRVVETEDSYVVYVDELPKWAPKK